MKILVRCIGGPEAGREWKFDGSGTITLGRDAGSMIQTPEGEQTISRRQSVICVQPPDVYVADAGSTHGTWVNSRKIGQQGQGERKHISDGAVIGVGKNGSAALFEIRIADFGGAGEGAGQMRFCVRCGRPLQPGEICRCQEQRNGRRNGGGGPVGYDIPDIQSAGRILGDKIGNTFRRLGSVYKDPVGQAKSLAAANDAATGNILVCINLIAVLIAGIIIAISINSKIGYAGNFVSWPLVVFCILLAASANYFGLAGLMLLSSRTFFGAGTTYAEMVGIVGIKAIWEGSFLLGSLLLGLLLPIAAFVIYAAGILFTWMLLLFCYAEVVPLSGSRKLYSAFAAVIGLALLDLIVYALLIGIVFSNVMSQLSDLSNLLNLSDLLNGFLY